MKTKLLYTFFALLLFTACSDKDSGGPEPKLEKTYLLYRKTSEIRLADGSKLTMEWQCAYDEDNRMARIDASSKSGSETNRLGTVMSYNVRGYLSQVINEKGRVWSIYYDSQNQPIEMVETYREVTPRRYINRFDGQGKLVEQTEYADKESAENLISITKLTYEKANQILIRRTLVSGEVDEEAKVLTDDKSKPLPVLLNQASLTFQPTDTFAEDLFTVHNVLSYEDLIPRSADDENRSFTTTYTYNEGGYPITSVKQFKSGAVETSSYTYLIK